MKAVSYSVSYFTRKKHILRQECETFGKKVALQNRVTMRKNKKTAHSRGFAFGRSDRIRTHDKTPKNAVTVRVSSRMCHILCHILLFLPQKIGKITIKRIVYLVLFLRHDVLINIFEHIVRRVSHALHGIFVRYTHCKHNGCMIMSQIV